MPDLLGPANPVPGYDKAVTNRNVPVSPENNVQLQNVPDPSRVIRADGRTERQDSDSQNSGIRYESNLQTFIQQLRDTPGMAQTLANLFSGREGTVVLSGMQEGIAVEMAKLLEMLRMDEGQLLDFLTGQARLGTRFGGALFDLLRGAYANASSESVQINILQFLKSYADHSSSGHIENSMLRDLERMADAMPARWAEQLRDMIAQLKNHFAAGDRSGAIQLLQRQVFSYMAGYVDQTHDMGLPRNLLTMLALNLARYENGTEQKLLEAFHQLRGFGTLKSQLGGVDDQTLLRLLENARAHGDSAAQRFSDQLVSAAARALRGEGSQEVQKGFQNLLAALLLNESVYMPINHYLLPLEWEDRLLFSELWVDPDAQEEGRGRGSEGDGNAVRFLLKVDVQSLGLFDIILTSRKSDVDVLISCPASVASFAGQIEQAVSQILTRHALTPTRVQVKKMERPVTLTEVFPKIYSGKDGINVKV